MSTVPVALLVAAAGGAGAAGFEISTFVAGLNSGDASCFRTAWSLVSTCQCEYKPARGKAPVNSIKGKGPVGSGCGGQFLQSRGPCKSRFADDIETFGDPESLEGGIQLLVEERQVIGRGPAGNGYW